MIELHKNDHGTLKAISTAGGTTTINQITKLTGLAHAAVMKAVLRLEMNEFIRLFEEKQVKTDHSYLNTSTRFVRAVLIV